MNNKVKHITKKLGYCCPYAYFRASAGEKQIVQASQLGVSERTIKNWHKWLREGNLKCQRNGICFIERRAFGEPVPQSPDTSSSGD